MYLIWNNYPMNPIITFQLILEWWISSGVNLLNLHSWFFFVLVFLKFHVILDRGCFIFNSFQVLNVTLIKLFSGTAGHLIFWNKPPFSFKGLFFSLIIDKIRMHIKWYSCVVGRFGDYAFVKKVIVRHLFSPT